MRAQEDFAQNWVDFAGGRANRYAMPATVENKLKMEGVSYVIRAPRKLSPEEMADAINYHVSDPESEPAKRVQVVTVLYVPRQAAMSPSSR